MAENQFETRPVTVSGADSKFINIGRTHVTLNRLQIGTVVVRIAGVDGFSDDGKLQRTGILCGMSKLYTRLQLKSGDAIKFQILGPSEILVIPDHAVGDEAAWPSEEPKDGESCIFSDKRLRPMHIKNFQPENFQDWTPNAEVDVFMAFGVLQTMTGYRYCCGVNASLLKKLGLEVEPKPDAILIDDETDEYRIAEFEVYSSAFAKHGHKPDHVDVLVVWIDDEKVRSKLPPKVVVLRQVAKDWAMDEAGEGEPGVGADSR